jgi:hypothetical protein
MGKYVDFLSFSDISTKVFADYVFHSFHFLLSLPPSLAPLFKACGFPHSVYIQNFFPLPTEYFSIFAVVLQLSVQDKKREKFSYEKEKCKNFHLLQSQPSQLFLSKECDKKTSKQFDTHEK